MKDRAWELTEMASNAAMPPDDCGLPAERVREPVTPSVPVAVQPATSNYKPAHRRHADNDELDQILW